MLIMSEHRNAKLDRESGKQTKESVGDSDKSSRPSALLTENVIHKLKLHCRIRSGAGHGGTVYCNDTWKGDIWSLIWVLRICTLTRYKLPACVSDGSPQLPHTHISSTAEAYRDAISVSVRCSLLSHICSSIP